MTQSRRKIKCPACKEWLHIQWNRDYKFERYKCSLCNARFRVQFDNTLRIPKVIKKEVLKELKKK